MRTLAITKAEYAGEYRLRLTFSDSAGSGFWHVPAESPAPSTQQVPLIGQF
ncbi:hypothetical protein [Spirosoma luteum]|uniref:hypothetical protein n=1 Tax=Spirosoma luteum TaxID=431553 RepID=UPI0003A3FC4F|nr:hypothetical protein [Spirosoma luteum]